MQFVLYLAVGGLSFLVDIMTFVALRFGAHLPTIPASVMSFSLATVANYLLCITIAFEGGRFRQHIEVLRFVSVAAAGLCLNTFFVWICIYEFALSPTASKIAVVPIVLAWNYAGRRLLVFGGGIPNSFVFRLQPPGIIETRSLSRH